MVDQLLQIKKIILPINAKPNYKPNEVIKNVRILSPASKKLAVIFPARNSGNLFITKKLEKRLVLAGYSVISFSYHPNLLEADIKRVQQSFKATANRALKEIHELDNRHKYQEIHLVGFSLGNMSLALVSSKLHNYTHATMVAPSSNMSKCLFEGISTQDLRRKFEKTGVTKSLLFKAWSKLAPGYYAESFKNKNVHLIISNRDKIIPTIYQYEFKKQLEKAGAQVRCSKSEVGHVMTIVNFCLFKDLN